MIRRLWAWLTTPDPAPRDTGDLAGRQAVSAWLTESAATR